jgi:hypothetical protein
MILGHVSGTTTSKNDILAVTSNCETRVQNHEPYAKLAVICLGLFRKAIFSDLNSRILCCCVFRRRGLVCLAVGSDLVVLHGCHACQRVDEDKTFEDSVGPRRFTCFATTTAASAIGDSVKGVNPILPVFRLSQGDHARTGHGG